jgi:four helix bundle protein
MKSYKELVVWQKSMELCQSIYKITSAFPCEEKFTLISQIRRSAVSIPTNIAEGRGRNSTKEYIRFLYIARGSCMELGSLTVLSNRLKYIDDHENQNINREIESILMMMNKLISRLKIPKEKQ